MHKVQMWKAQMHKIQMPKLQMSMLVIHHRQFLISQFLKILLKDFGELMTMNLILVHWSMILGCVVKYENMMLIIERKFEKLTLKLWKLFLEFYVFS